MMIPEEYETGTHPIARVVMTGDFPRRPDVVGGGVESVMLYLCEHLARMPDIELSVVTLERWGRRGSIETFGNYVVHYVEQSRFRGPLKRYINGKRITAAIKKCNPDLVHAHIAGQYSQAAAACKVPHVLTLHGIRFLEANLKTGMKDRLYRRHIVRSEEKRGIRDARDVISINPFIEETFQEQIRGNVYTIENPVADKWFEIDAPGDPLGLLYAGRITPRKDILGLIEAFRLFHAKYPDAKLNIAGSPDNPDSTGYFDSVRAYINRHHLQDSINFLGNLSESELIEEYRSNAIFVIASILETAPMSIGQAMAAGRLVVATDAGGCRHMVVNRESGMIVPIGDSEAFAAALIACAQDKELSSRLREQARNAANSRFRAGPIAIRTADIYKRILRGQNSADCSN